MAWIDQEKKGTKTSIALQIICLIFAIVFSLILLFFIYVQFFVKSERFFTGSSSVYNQVWYYVDDEGQTRACYFPCELSINPNSAVKVFTSIPSDIEDGTYMCFLTNKSMNVYVADELRFTFDNNDNPIPGGYVKSHYMVIELSRDDRGRILTVERYDTSEDNRSFNQVVCGDIYGLATFYLRQDGFQFASAIILLVFSILVMLISLLLRIIYKHRMSVAVLAFGTALSSLWFIFDSFLYQVVFNNYYVDGPMEYMLIMTCPYMFVIYLNSEQKYRYRKVFTVLGIVMLINYTVITTLHFSGIRSYQNNLLFVGLSAGMVILVMLVTIFIDVFKHRVKEYRLVAFGFMILLLSGIIQIIILNTMVDVHDAKAFMAGMYLILTIGTINMVLNLIEVEDQARNAKQASDLKSSFLANMSHEIRTPINAIMGMNEMILRESSEEEIKRYAANVSNAGVSLLGIINDILDFSKIESGKLEIHNEDYHLSSLVNDVSTLISDRAGRKNLEFKISADSELPEELHGDRNRINQVLLNILNNAVKYTEKGSVTLRVAMKEPDEELFTGEALETSEIPDTEMRTLIFEVSDTGIGIKEEDKAKLFRQFERLDGDKTKNIEGTGLGLAITNNLVQLMGGSISVQSVYGEGSVFTVYLPQKVVGDSKLGSLEERSRQRQDLRQEYKESFTAPEAKILVVDDAPVNILVVKGLLKKTKMTVDSAKSGKECLEKCDANRYDLILLDHMMPEMDGIETLHLLKEQHPDICPVIVLTANAIEGMREMYLSEGFTDYLAKPTNSDDLERIVRENLPKEKVIIVE